MGGLKLGIDFTGGTLLEVTFSNKEITMQKFSEIFQENLGKEKGEKIITTENGFIVRSRQINVKDQEIFFEKLKAEDNSLEIKRTTSIGPTVGNIFKKNAIKALLIAIIAIVAFIAFSFRRVPKNISPFKFSLAAILALVHDVLLTVGFFAFLGLSFEVEIDGLFITALLTVMGFSVHDTIVVFDRIRENLKGRKTKRFAEIAEKSLWQTMTRSINTSLSTLIVLIALMLLGSETLYFFLLALIVGISAGTYSSIFLAVPLLVSWEKKK